MLYNVTQALPARSPSACRHLSDIGTTVRLVASRLYEDDPIRNSILASDLRSYEASKATATKAQKNSEATTSRKRDLDP